jgi:hypothetical protein
MNHDVKMLVGLAISGKLTAEQWLQLPLPLQQQLLPFLIQQQARRSPRELREISNQIAKGASWGLFTAEMQQLAAVLLGLVVIAAVLVGLFVILAVTFGRAH